MLYALFAVSFTVFLACVGCTQLYETVGVLTIVVTGVHHVGCYMHCCSGVQHVWLSMFGSFTSVSIRSRSVELNFKTLLQHS